MLGNPAGRHLPHQVKKAADPCPECNGVGYVGPILGIHPCPRGCAEKKNENSVWSEQERLERLPGDKGRGGK